jgi:hypothetical protein
MGGRWGREAAVLMLYTPRHINIATGHPPTHAAIYTLKLHQSVAGQAAIIIYSTYTGSLLVHDI